MPLRAAAEADEIGESTLKSVDIRIAHPCLASSR
jgi:hypothetical protein